MNKTLIAGTQTIKEWMLVDLAQMEYESIRKQIKEAFASHDQGKAGMQIRENDNAGQKRLGETKNN